MKSISYIAKATDSRCKWWAVKIPENFNIPDLDDCTITKNLGYLKSGADLELEEGESVLMSEAEHHSKNRGYCVRLVFVKDGNLYQIARPDSQIKKNIKNWASDDQWNILKKGSGDVAACLRMLIAIRQGMKICDLNKDYNKTYILVENEWEKHKE